MKIVTVCWSAREWLAGPKNDCATTKEPGACLPAIGRRARGAIACSPKDRPAPSG